MSSQHLVSVAWTHADVARFHGRHGPTQFIHDIDKNTPSHRLRVQYPFLHGVFCLLGIMHKEDLVGSSAHFKINEHVRQTLGEALLASPLPMDAIYAILLVSEEATDPSQVRRRPQKRPRVTETDATRTPPTTLTAGYSPDTACSKQCSASTFPVYYRASSTRRLRAPTRAPSAYGLPCAWAISAGLSQPDGSLLSRVPISTTAICSSTFMTHPARMACCWPRSCCSGRSGKCPSTLASGAISSTSGKRNGTIFCVCHPLL